MTEGTEQPATESFWDRTFTLEDLGIVTFDDGREWSLFNQYISYAEQPMRRCSLHFSMYPFDKPFNVQEEAITKEEAQSLCVLAIFENLESETDWEPGEPWEPYLMPIRKWEELRREKEEEGTVELAQPARRWVRFECTSGKDFAVIDTSQCTAIIGDNEGSILVVAGADSIFLKEPLEEVIAKLGIDVEP